MKRGVWHQCGDKSQNLVLEQLNLNNGVGVVLSPRDISFDNATKFAAKYRDLGADVIIDPQFYNPHFDNRFLITYPIHEYRASVSGLSRINSNQRPGLANSLRTINNALHTTAVLSPALIYEAGRDDLIDLNSNLFSLAKSVGDDLGIPTYAAILLAKSASISENTISTILSSATSLSSDGFYFGFEFNQNRIPDSYEDILRLGSSILTLACTGKPVLHSFAGPMSLLSLGFGSTGTAIGHSQNLWQFTRGRWEPPASGGGGGDAPPRYFSKNLWGTFVYPDELFLLSSSTLRNRLITPTPFSNMLDGVLSHNWKRWEANKHLLNIIGTTILEQSQNALPEDCATYAIELLNEAINLGADILKAGLTLRDRTCCYQGNWKLALTDGLTKFRNDYDYLSLLR